MSEATEKKFQKLVREIGRLIRAEADTNLFVQKGKTKAKPRMDAPRWTSAYLDARWFSDAEGFTAKLRVVLPDGKLNGVQISTDIAALLDKVWKLRKEDSAAAWYGLKVTVNPNGVVTTDFNNDPNCVVDPSWYHS